MASRPETDFFRDGKSCLSFLNDCGANPSIDEAPGFPGRKRQLTDERSEMKEAEDLLASELSKLSVQERSKALDDVHCVGEELEETPEMIERSLREFDQIVQTTTNQIYTIAVNQNRSYVEDRSFRLRFLRANLFNIRKSVHQMMSFLQQKALYFGEAKVTQDIVPDDLNREAIALLRSGFFQTLKDRDRNGRVIVYNSSFDRMPVDCKIETLIHFLYHMVFNIILSIPTVQTKGVVFIHYDESKGDCSKFPGLNLFLKANNFFHTLPMRGSSMHICLHSAPGSLTVYNKMIQMMLNRASSDPYVARTRVHYGSDLERQYRLRSFGIPLNNFPVDKNGNIRSEIHEAWCDEYLENVPSTTCIDPQEGSNDKATTTPFSSIVETDVLLGRGRMVQNHSGNIRFRKFLALHAEDYDGLPRNHKLAARIGYTQQLLSSGTRFLKQTDDDTGMWVVCDFDEAEVKVSQFFRTRRRDRRRG